MNTNRLLFWAAIFCFLFLYIVFFEQPEEIKEDNDTEETAMVFPVAREKLKGIEITFKDKKMSVEKKDGSWKLVLPPGAAVKKELIDSLISAVLDTVIINVVEENPESLVQYGLDAPEIKIRVLCAGHPDAITLFLGQKSPAGVSLYAGIEGQSRVFLTGDYIRFSIKTFAKSLRVTK